ncbi:hypothetical protein [Desertibaculum subflavum]|uniref:hypothetical protein n=1 Tax=Desertibaculum subflavum TaxID=2268458 RepID=UPI0013C5298F
MKHRLLAAAAIAAGAMLALPAPSLAQTPEAWPGIVMSVSGAAAISTRGMPPGSEIWAVWYSLPSGKAVEEGATAAKWAYVEMTLSGSAVVTGGPTPMCQSIGAGGVPSGTSERVTDPGDVEICNFASLPGTRTENRGTQPYVFAGLAVGGPWKEDMEDDVDLYLKAKGQAKAAHVTPAQFRDVEKEILAAGAMTVVIRNVTMAPGTQIVTTDRYPTLRMVETGKLVLSSTPKGARGPIRKTLEALDFMEWTPAKADEQFVLSNDSDQPVQFVEWNVAPAQGAKP